MPQLTLIKTLLAQDTTESRQQAAELLDELQAFQVSIHNKVFLIDVLALQALLHDARGEEQAALDKLTEAIALAEPGGFIRLFVDMGPRMAYLLERLIGKNVAVDYIGQLLAAFSDDETVSPSLPIPPVPQSALSPGRAPDQPRARYSGAVATAAAEQGNL